MAALKNGISSLQVWWRQCAELPRRSQDYYLAGGSFLVKNKNMHCAPPITESKWACQPPRQKNKKQNKAKQKAFQKKQPSLEARNIKLV